MKILLAILPMLEETLDTDRHETFAKLAMKGKD